ncbi:hypothetical protein [Terrarubrum flagellatum]|uniref:hypothetical protein n=1 Tax=Terrirubrum flagellatum TaxID=2895980 RepID=UPI00314529E2
MADYYPLIARAVAAVKDAPAETRAQVYERARGALMRHLKSANPPLTPEAIEREDAALDDAVARVEAEILSGDQPGETPEAPPAPVAENADREVVRRPAAPIASPPGGEAADRQKRLRAMAFGGVAAAVAVGVALFALTRREDASRYSPQPAAAEAASPAAGPKLGERVTGETADVSSQRRPDAPAAPTTQQASQTAPAIAQPPIAVAQRAILYEQKPATPNEPTIVNGRAVWRLDSASADPTQAPDTVVRAEIEFPERSLKVDMTIRRNTDPALPASHLVEIKFQFAAGGGPVKELASPPTMKTEENQRGAPLVALQVPVTENYFLVGLSNLPSDVERNIAQLQAANWIDLPFRFADDRIGVIAIEKGAQGADVLQSALERWRS